MTFLQRKQKLIDRLENTYDEDILNKIEQILDLQNDVDTESPYIKDGVLHFSPELKERIDAALERTMGGKGVSDEDMKKRFAKWLNPTNEKE